MKITLFIDGGEVYPTPREYLGVGVFKSFLAACKAASGSQYDRSTRRWSVPPTSIESLTRSLQGAGFTVSAAPEVQAALDQTYEREAGERERMAQVKSVSGFELFPFQVEGAAWLRTRRTALLGDEMGLGKTVQTLAAIPAGGRALVVCPACVKLNWASEVREWRPDLTPVPLKGRKAFRWPEPGEVVIVNYDILPAVEKCPKPPAGVHVIGDEIHYTKSNKAARTKKWRNVRLLACRNGGCAWGLSGTPLVNRPPELWAVLTGLGLSREAYGSWVNFIDVFNGSPQFFGGFEWGTPKPAAAAGLKNVMLRRRRDAVLTDLPAKQYSVVPVEIGPRSEAARLANDLIKALQEKGVDLEKVDDLVELSAAGIDFEQLSKCRKALAQAKVGALEDLVAEYEEAEEPVLVFSYHRDAAEVLGAREGWEVITGDVSAEKRQEIVEVFQAGELRGIAATIQAAGVGLTLTRACHAIFLDQAWTPAENRQAEDRIHRIGQDRGVVITQLVASHFLDERVAELLREKTSINEASVEAAAGPRERLVIQTTDDPPVAKKSTTRRAAVSEREVWAAMALAKLASHDSDFARERNFVGFSSADGRFGHSLARQIITRGGLTEKQWGAAIKLCAKYHRQVGPCPEKETA